MGWKFHKMAAAKDENKLKKPSKSTDLMDFPMMNGEYEADSNVKWFLIEKSSLSFW